MIVTVAKRYGEWIDIRDFIRPRDWMLALVLGEIRDRSPVSLLNWTIQSFIYPPGNPLIADEHRQVAYQVPNQVFSSTPDFWNFPAETIRDGIADCEDRVHLLVGMLRAMGWSPDQVYATIGLYGSQGHAWVVLRRHDGQFDLLETTLISSVSGDQVPIEQPPYRPFFRYNDEQVLVVERVEIPEIRIRGGIRG